MSFDPKHGRYCDECGRTIAKASRVYQSLEYCNTCYQRVFPRIACTRCGSGTRQHRRAQEPAVCAACRRIDRVCGRCRKPVPRAALIVAEQAICGACAPHFRPKQACTACGRPSARLSRPLFAGLTDRVCDACRNRISHATCSVCRRYRPVASPADRAAPRCRDCHGDSPATHACPACGAAVAGTGAGRCGPCLAASQARRIGALAAAMLEKRWARELYEAFIEHLLQAGTPSARTSKCLQASAEFFLVVERAFDDAGTVTRAALARNIGTAALRANLLASRFLVERLGLRPDEREVQRATERVRFDSIVQRSAREPYGWVVRAYAQYLLRRAVPIRTARLYLRAAEAFCEAALAEKAAPWPSEVLVRYLRRHPGHAASLGRFIGFCQEGLGWDVRRVEKSQWHNPRARTDRAVGVLRDLLSRIEGMPLESAPDRTLGQILSLALGVARTQLDASRRTGEVTMAAPNTIRVGGLEPIVLNGRLLAIAETWLRRV